MSLRTRLVLLQASLASSSLLWPRPDTSVLITSPSPLLLQALALASQCCPRSPPVSPRVPSFFSLPFSSHLRTLVPLSFQAKLGQEIGTLPIPQIHSCSCSTGGEPGPPLQERNQLRCHCFLPAGGRDVYIPLKDMPRSFPATW